MSKGIVTEYPEICIFCGRQAEAEHHLIFGTAGRELSEKDGLKIPVCNNCHNMGQKLCRIHENPMAERLSKMLGQAIWEKEWILANGPYVGMPDTQQESKKAREAFRKRYGRSYL
jgi:hypothetical protein